MDAVCVSIVGRVAPIETDRVEALGISGYDLMASLRHFEGKRVKITLSIEPREKEPVAAEETF